MNQQDPLSQLRDIHLPATGGFWPPAPGWWLLALLLIGLVVLSTLFWIRRRQKRRWRLVARQELIRLEHDAEATSAWFNRLNTLLKQCARQCHPDARPDSLSGQVWIDFLLSTAPEDRIASRPVVEAMVEACWNPHTEADPGHALGFAKRWLEGQKC
jgi:HAMP domain-containing protein